MISQVIQWTQAIFHEITESPLESDFVSQSQWRSLISGYISWYHLISTGIRLFFMISLNIDRSYALFSWSHYIITDLRLYLSISLSFHWSQAVFQDLTLNAKFLDYNSWSQKLSTDIRLCSLISLKITDRRIFFKISPNLHWNQA